MKSVGEAMAFGRSFPEALQKAMRSLERKNSTFSWNFTETRDELYEAVFIPTEHRLIQVQKLLTLGESVDSVHKRSGIDPWFLTQIQSINLIADQLKSASDLSGELLRKAKKLGFSDSQIAECRNTTASEILKIRERLEIYPVYKTVDTCAGEFEAFTPYHYSSYDLESEVKPRTRPAILILGSGPNRIGQGIEFDYSCVHACFALSIAGFETIMINCNPETVSTDYDTSDRLYFEPLTLEDVLEIYRAELKAGPIAGVIVQLGGQTPLGLSAGLKAAGVPILGTSPDAIHLAEDRGAFGKVLEETGLRAPQFGTAFSYEEALKVATSIGYPVLVRPSFVLGGRGMQIVYDDSQLSLFIEIATQINPEHPVLIDKFLDDAIEIDVDALYDGEELYLAGIMEHVEEAGVHSGDSACVIPPQSIHVSQIAEISEATKKLAHAIGVRGLINIQYAISHSELYVLEANPRASRTVPFVSKATGVQVAKAAALIACGKSIHELRASGSLPKSSSGAAQGVSVKEAVLPWNRFRRRDGEGVDSVLGPEMKSTGEVMGLADSFGAAFAKSQIAAFGPLPKEGAIFISLSDKDKEASLTAVKGLKELGFTLHATAGTRDYLSKHGVETLLVAKHAEKEKNPDAYSAVDLIAQNKISLVINTPFGRGAQRDGRMIRTSAVQRGISCITTVPGLKAAVEGIKQLRRETLTAKSIQDWHRV
jgi:carbamoyl-phosphate synthase large subunit